jgi:hypothetical protein
MNVTLTYLCVRCNDVAVEAKGFRCEACRLAHAAYQKKYDARKKLGNEKPCINPYRGMRPCSQRMSENCLKTFLSPDRRAVHCCPPCRHMQLLQSYEWAGE